MPSMLRACTPAWHNIACDSVDHQELISSEAEPCLLLQIDEADWQSQLSLDVLSSQATALISAAAAASMGLTGEKASSDVDASELLCSCLQVLHGLLALEAWAAVGSLQQQACPITPKTLKMDGLAMHETSVARTLWGMNWHTPGCCGGLFPAEDLAFCVQIRVDVKRPWHKCCS